MKYHRMAAVLLTLACCLCFGLPAAVAAEQRAELEGLTVKVRCTGSDIPAERLTIRLTPREDAPMPDDAKELEVTLNTADCKESSDQTARVEFPGTFVFTKPGQYEYEVVQEKGRASNGTYDARTLVVRVTAGWNDETFGCVVKVLEDGAPSDEKKDELLFVNRYAREDSPLPPPYIPCDPPPCPDPSEPPSVPVQPDVPETPTVIPPEPETPVSVPTPTEPGTPTLIQTGQDPVRVWALAGLGAALLTAGALLRRKDRKDEDA